jgi:hypothetical protein
MWLFSHIGLGGNSAADEALTAAVGLAAGTVSVPFADFYAIVNRYVKRKWQLAWDAEIKSRLHAIELVIHGSRPLNCRDETKS